MNLKNKLKKFIFGDDESSSLGVIKVNTPNFKIKAKFFNSKQGEDILLDINQLIRNQFQEVIK